MIAFVPVIATLALGWGLWRRIAPGTGFPGRLAGSTLAGIAAMIAWMALLDLAGVRWGAAVLLAPVVPALLLGIGRGRAPRPPRRGDGWAAAAAGATLVRAAAIAAVPAFGWDFRFIWGLKARAFALAGGHDAAWLAWPGHTFAHPSYPPAWSDLIAAGVVLGAGAAAAAAAWQALLAVALAAVCWEITAGAPPWARALAATAAAWSPVLFDPKVSGYAEPLLAFVAAAGLGALPRLARGDRGAMPVLSIAAALLALTKNEGAALALGLGIAAVAVAGLTRSWPVLASAGAAVLAWQCTLPAWLAAGEAALAPSLAAAAGHAAALPAALVAATGRTPALVAVLAAWAVCLAAWWGHELRGVRLACGFWALAALGAYLSTTADLTWHLATSADRVLAVPLPAVLALALASCLSGSAPAGGRSAPASSRGGSPSG